MGQITQIAFELRNLTQQALDDESSEDDEAPTEAMIQKRAEMDTWVKFCKAKIDKIEKVWNKKLEDSTNDEDDHTGKPESAEDED